jgi:hypothetical protein
MVFTQEQKNCNEEIVQKAWEDSNSKQELMTSPVTTIEKSPLVKLNLPEGKPYGQRSN